MTTTDALIVALIVAAFASFGVSLAVVSWWSGRRAGLPDKTIAADKSARREDKRAA